MSTATKAPAANRFRMDKSAVGPITLLTFHGIVDEGFDGKKLAESIKTKKVIMNLRDVRRFASWGMAEWMSFLRAHTEADLYLVECSQYAVNQFNLVTGLLGHAKLVSFYAPYRCAACDAEFETMVLVPEDRGAANDIADSEQVCPTCGGSARMEKYPATMCQAMLERPPFDIEDDVLAYLRGKLKYNLVPDQTRFRAYRKVADGDTYLRLSGSLAKLPAEVLGAASAGRTVVDLASITFQPHELAPWRSYLQAAMPNVTSLQLLDCPPRFLEHAVHVEDLNAKVRVRTFALMYNCPSCGSATTGLVDVAANLEPLTEGVIPSALCPSCNAMLVADATGEEAALLRHLPAREHDLEQDQFLDKARTEPADKLEDVLATRPSKAAAAAPASSRGMWLSAALAILLVAGLGLVAYILWIQHEEPKPAAVVTHTEPAKPQQPQFQRPDWITSDQPASAFCHDMINRLMCVGVSSYRGNRNDAVAEANDAALEELVNTIGLKITDGFFKDNELAGYSAARAAALDALTAADVDRKSPAYATADDTVSKARHRVVDVFQRTGGPAVPSQRSDWYWEEYAAAEKGKTEFLVFVRYDIALDGVRALVERYSTATPVKGSAAVPAFPSLAWQYPDFTGGAMLTKVGSPLASAKLAARAIIMAAGDQKVTDATVLAKALDDWAKGSGKLTLTVKAADQPVQTVELKR